MNRRAALCGFSALTLAGCGLSTRVYIERREWPLDPARQAASGGVRSGRGVLLLRAVRAGPAVLVRGLQTRQADGSVSVAFYDEFLAAPADLFEAALRRWLTDSGKYAAVTTPGSRLDPALVLDCELTALIADPAAGEARCDASILLTRESRPIIQSAVSGRAPLPPAADPATIARALRGAAGDACGKIEAALG